MKGTISGANRPDTDALIAALRGGFVLRGRGEVFEEARFKARYVIYIYIYTYATLDELVPTNNASER